MKKYSNARVDEAHGDALNGVVKWAPAKSLWISTMYLGALGGGTAFFTWDAVLLFLVTSGVTLCAGHSIGMHRKLIHQSFECSDRLEKILVYLGTLVGLGGPMTMMYIHDLRDWAQRQNQCHDYFGHRRSIMKDAWWQIHCSIHLINPPAFIFDRRVESSRFYQYIERTAMLQQLPWALGFFLVGGWSWVFWGVCVRVAVGVTGHWFIGYFAHNTGGRHWHVVGAAVQGYDVNFCSLITFGESWHNNHHAFPGSARLGIHKGQMDPGWWLIRALEATGFVSNIVTSQDLPERPELLRLRL